MTKKDCMPYKEILRQKNHTDNRLIEKLRYYNLCLPATPDKEFCASLLNLVFLPKWLGPIDPFAQLVDILLAPL